MSVKKDEDIRAIYIFLHELSNGCSTSTETLKKVRVLLRREGNTWKRVSQKTRFVMNLQSTEVRLSQRSEQHRYVDTLPEIRKILLQASQHFIRPSHEEQAAAHLHNVRRRTCRHRTGNLRRLVRSQTTLRWHQSIRRDLAQTFSGNLLTSLFDRIVSTESLIEIPIVLDVLDLSVLRSLERSNKVRFLSHFYAQNITNLLGTMIITKPRLLVTSVFFCAS